MMGFKTIPVYTRYIDTLGLAGWETTDSQGFDAASHLNEDHRFISFVLDDTSFYYDHILKYLTPVDIEATDQIIDRIQDAEYWNRYQTSLSGIQQEFGFYHIAEAPRIAADHIKHFLEHGTFLTAELAARNDSITGEILSVKAPYSYLL